MFSCVLRVLAMTIVTRSSAVLYNAALYKPAAQISTWEPNYAYKAVDGNSDPDVNHGYCQHTDQHLTPWWMVDLRGQFIVEQIKLTNRQDGLFLIADRLRNFDIDIFQQDPRQLTNFPDITGQVCYHQGPTPGRGTFLYNCTTPIVGRYVRLIMRLGFIDNLHICELEVLVNGSSFEEVYFNKKEDTRLSGKPLITLTATDSSYCLQECLRRRSTIYCTALNWVTSTRSCQLFSVNPFLDLTVNLTSAAGTHFYSQDNSSL
uniref:Apple domain-containing protein n=1 Tax=Biomphalaria glabrata TaxID=6526 RepID=A0A2C9KNW3_BIOGL